MMVGQRVRIAEYARHFGSGEFVGLTGTIREVFDDGLVSIDLDDMNAVPEQARSIVEHMGAVFQTVELESLEEIDSADEG